MSSTLREKSVTINRIAQSLLILSLRENNIRPWLQYNIQRTIHYRLFTFLLWVLGKDCEWGRFCLFFINVLVFSLDIFYFKRNRTRQGKSVTYLFFTSRSVQLYCYWSFSMRRCSDEQTYNSIGPLVHLWALV